MSALIDGRLFYGLLKDPQGYGSAACLGVPGDDLVDVLTHGPVEGGGLYGHIEEGASH
jgi:hypothetical protein